MSTEFLLLRPLSSHPRLLSSIALARGCSQRHYLIQQECNALDKSWKNRVAGCCTNKHIRLRISKLASSNGWKQLNATSGHSLEPESEVYSAMEFWNLLQSSLNTFYRFSRPHTVIGTALSITSVSILSVEKFADFSPLFFTGLLQALVSALFMNIYIVGLNQLFDVEIDKVNKPTLPLASGEYSLRTGTTIVSVFAILSFGIGLAVGSWPLFWALLISFILGTAYSINLPFFRWKRFAVVAALCILAVRAVIVQLAFFLHMQIFVFRRPANFSKPLIFATTFMAFFSVVIALFKDIPDIDGDRIFGIRSFTVRLGQKPIFWTCVYLLEMAYSVAIVIGATSTCLWSKLATVLGHTVLASILWNKARSVNLMKAVWSPGEKLYSYDDATVEEKQKKNNAIKKVTRIPIIIFFIIFLYHVTWIIWTSDFW